MSLNEPADGEAAPVQRRRGAALRDALLEAAWAELIDRGYDALTMESVAARAKTSRAVLYRRWPAKPDLVAAAVAEHAFRDRVRVPDTGTLRGDLIALLRAADKARTPFAILITSRLGSFHDESGTSYADLRDRMLAGRPSSLQMIFDRAVARGEVDPAKLSPRVVDVAFDLYRNEVLMRQSSVPDDVLVSIVDEVALPLVRTDRRDGAPSDDATAPPMT